MPSTPPISNLVVVVAPPGPMAGVRDILTDWSGAELVESFLWIDSGAVVSARVPGLLIKDGRAHPTTLQQLLAAGRYGQLRVCILVPALGTAAGVPLEVETQISELAAESSGGAQVHRLRCIVTRPDSGDGAVDLAREGWHNIILSPEDSRGPGLGHRLLEATEDPIELGPHAAATLAGVAGLWRGAEVGPLDAEVPPPGKTVRVARSFYRNLDARDVEHQVRDGVTSMAKGLPQPRSGNTRAVYVEDAALATHDMAAALLTKHKSFLRGPRVARSTAVAQEIGIWQALKMLFGFLWAAIKNAPMTWYQNLIHGLASKGAAAAHKLVFGTAPAAYEVVVKGVRADGMPVGIDELVAASAQLNDAVGGRAIGGVRASTHTPQADLSALWQDYVSATFTLADGGDRSDAMPAVRIGTDLGVLRSVQDAIPSVDDRFTEIPDAVAVAIDYDSVQAADLLGIQTVRDRLAKCAEDPALALEAGRVRSAFDAWHGARVQCFAVQIGAHLTRFIRDTTAEVRGLLQSLAAASTAPDPTNDLRERQRRLSRWMRILMIIFVACAATLILLGSFEVLEWDTVGIAGAIVLVVWFVATLLIFMKGQRELFRELHRRAQAASEAETNQANLQQATKDLRRLTDGYGQFLAWTRVLGVVLPNPYGEHPRPVTVSARLDDGLPLCAQLGVAQPRPEITSEAVVRVRREIFGFGWLSGPWNALLADAGRRVGPDAIDVTENPDEMYGQPGTPDSFLTRWADDLEKHGPGSIGGDQLMSKVMEKLALSPIGERLVSEVKAGAEPPQARSDFMAGVDLDPGVDLVRRGPDLPESGQFLDPAVFGRQARISNQHAIVVNKSITTRSSLGQIAVLTQFTEGLPVYQLAGTQESIPEDHWHPPEGDLTF